MAYTETTSTSLFGNIKNAFAGLLFGIVLFIAGFPLLWWNEGRSVTTYKTLAEVRENHVAVSADAVDPNNDGKLIHLSGPTSTEEVLKDPKFGIAEQAIRLRRTAEIYQWEENKRTETKKKTGGGTEKTTTYTYDKVWTSAPISSSAFKEAGHENSGTIPYPSSSWDANNVKLSAFQLTESLIRSINNYETYDATTAELPAELAPDLKPYNSGYYLGDDPSRARIGDVRYSFSIVRPSTASVLAQQSGESFAPYTAAKTGKTFSMLKVGVFSAEEMIQEREAANKMLTWLLRAVGLLAMFLGINLLFRPLVAIGNVLPFIGNIVGGAGMIVAGLLSIMFGATTIGAAWVFYRPLLGIPLLLVGVGCLVMLILRKKGQSAAGIPAATNTPMAPPPPPPPPGA